MVQLCLPGVTQVHAQAHCRLCVATEPGMVRTLSQRSFGVCVYGDPSLRPVRRYGSRREGPA